MSTTTVLANGASTETESDPMNAPKASITVAMSVLLEDKVPPDPSPATMQWEFLYRCGYTIVLHKHGEWLYRQAETLLVRRLHEISASLSASTDASFLQDLLRHWRGHGGSRGFGRNLLMVRDILLYMDR
jgi:hypothetical protein